ncbi:hypothetical protein B0H19DRAFT_1071688 [Mycena capillaripes]|nr:hypothetical protein B0H19DRAFT_1071688 [Mycena capillaripes]
MGKGCIGQCQGRDDADPARGSTEWCVRVHLFRNGRMGSRAAGSGKREAGSGKRGRSDGKRVQWAVPRAGRCGPSTGEYGMLQTALTPINIIQNQLPKRDTQTYRKKIEQDLLFSIRWRIHAKSQNRPPAPTTPKRSARGILHTSLFPLEVPIGSGKRGLCGNNYAFAADNEKNTREIGERNKKDRPYGDEPKAT